MKHSYQHSDMAQKGPGTHGTRYHPTAPSAPSFGSAGNAKSGTSQSTSRGKQGG